MKLNKIFLSLIMSLCFITPSHSITIKNAKFNKREYSQEKSVKLVGAGLRVKYFFDVYAVGFYSESGECNRQDLIYSKEAKKVKIVLLRDIERKRFMETIVEVFNQQIPSNSPKLLKDQVQKFYALLFEGQEKISKGSVYVFDYIPNRGLFLYENGQPAGILNSASNMFMEAFLSIWLGNDTCCPDTLKEIMKCQK